MSLAAIRNGLYETLTACGPYSAADVSACDFGILESTNACAVVFTPGTDSAFEPLTFGQGGSDQKAWSIEGTVFVKDTGDPLGYYGRVWQAHDDLWDTVNKDRSLQSASTKHAGVVSMSFNPDVGREAAGAFWGEVKFKIVALEYE